MTSVKQDPVKATAREFWIADDGGWNAIAYTSERKFDLNTSDETKIHVIEYTALQSVQDELELAKKSNGVLSDANTALRAENEKLKQWQKDKRNRMSNHDAVTLTIHEATKKENAALTLRLQQTEAREKFLKNALGHVGTGIDPRTAEWSEQFQDYLMRPFADLKSVGKYAFEALNEIKGEAVEQAAKGAGDANKP